MLKSESLLSETQYGVTPYRHVIVVLFCASIIANLGLGICFTPIQSNLRDIYQLSIYMVTFITRIVGHVLTPILNLPANYFIDKYGLKTGVLLGNAMTMGALWISTLCNKSFMYLLAGQILAAVGHAFLLSVPQKISVVWYAPEKRVLSTTVMSMAILLGNAVGAQFPNFFVDNDAAGESGAVQIYNMLFFMAILGTVLLLPTFVLFQEKPKIAPSKVADTKSISYKESFKMLLKNKNAWFLILGGSLVLGTNFTIAAVLQLILKPFEFTNDTVGYCITFSIILGLPSSLWLGGYVGRTRKYKSAVVGVGLAATISLGSIVLAAISKDALLMKLAFCVFGFVVNPLYPILCEFLCEVSFPVSELTVGGIFYTLSQLLGTAESFGADAVLDIEETPEYALYCFYLMILVNLAGVFLLVGSKQDLKRTYYENNPLLQVYSIEEGQSEFDSDKTESFKEQ